MVERCLRRRAGRAGRLLLASTAAASSPARRRLVAIALALVLAPARHAGAQPARGDLAGGHGRRRRVRAADGVDAGVRRCGRTRRAARCSSTTARCSTRSRSPSSPRSRAVPGDLAWVVRLLAAAIVVVLRGGPDHAARARRLARRRRARRPTGSRTRSPTGTGSACWRRSALVLLVHLATAVREPRRGPRAGRRGDPDRGRDDLLHVLARRRSPPAWSGSWCCSSSPGRPARSTGLAAIVPACAGVLVVAVGADRSRSDDVRHARGHRRGPPAGARRRARRGRRRRPAGGAARRRRAGWPRAGRSRPRRRTRARLGAGGRRRSRSWWWPAGAPGVRRAPVRPVRERRRHAGDRPARAAAEPGQQRPPGPLARRARRGSAPIRCAATAPGRTRSRGTATGTSGSTSSTPTRCTWSCSRELGIAWAGAARRRRSGPCSAGWRGSSAGRERGPPAALLAAGVVWAVHAGLDWDWEMPATAIWLFAAGGWALAAPEGAPRLRPPHRPARVAMAAACLVLTLAPCSVARSQAALDDASRAFAAGDCRRAIDRSLASLDATRLRPQPYELLAYCDVRLGAGRARAEEPRRGRRPRSQLVAGLVRDGARARQAGARSAARCAPGGRAQPARAAHGAGGGGVRLRPARPSGASARSSSRSRDPLRSATDRARRGGSGALHPQSALAGLNPLPRGAAPGPARRLPAAMAGSRAM